MNHNDIMIQAVGMIGLAVILFSYQIDNRKKLLFVQSLGNLIFIIQFLFLGAYSGIVSYTLGTIRNIVAYYKNDRKWAKTNAWVYFFIMLSIIMTAFVWEGYLSVLSILGFVFLCIAVWQNEPKSMRRYLLLVSPPWIIYNYLSGSISATIMECLVWLSCIISIFRYDRLRKSHKDKVS